MHIINKSSLTPPQVSDELIREALNERDAIVQEIFSFLPVSELARCSQVCSYWKTLMDNNLAWYSLLLERYGTETTARSETLKEALGYSWREVFTHFPAINFFATTFDRQDDAVFCHGNFAYFVEEGTLVCADKDDRENILFETVIYGTPAKLTAYDDSLFVLYKNLSVARFNCYTGKLIRIWNLSNGSRTIVWPCKNLHLFTAHEGLVFVPTSSQVITILRPDAAQSAGEFLEDPFVSKARQLCVQEDLLWLLKGSKIVAINLNTKERVQSFDFEETVTVLSLVQNGNRAYLGCQVEPDEIEIESDESIFYKIYVLDLSMHSIEKIIEIDDAVVPNHLQLHDEILYVSEKALDGDNNYYFNIMAVDLDKGVIIDQLEELTPSNHESIKNFINKTQKK